MHAALSTPVPDHTPYAQAWANTLYHRLFCDRVQDFRAQPGVTPARWQAALCGPLPELRGAAAAAADRGADPRVRLLACHVLRAHGAALPQRELLGVVVEAPAPGGLQTLAAYADGSVHTLNPQARLELMEPAPPLRGSVQRLLDASAAVLPHIGPWSGVRRAAPPAGHLRLNFLLTDGLYFGEGERSVMQHDGLAGPVVAAVAGLQQQVAALAFRHAA